MPCCCAQWCLLLLTWIVEPGLLVAAPLPCKIPTVPYCALVNSLSCIVFSLGNCHSKLDPRALQIDMYMYCIDVVHQVSQSIV